MLEAGFIAGLDTSGSARQKPGCTEASLGKANRMKTLEYKVKKFLLDKHVDFHKPLAIAFREDSIQAFCFISWFVFRS